MAWVSEKHDLYEFDEREEFDRIVKQRIKELKGALE
jgi:hypothetical protein